MADIRVVSVSEDVRIATSGVIDRHDTCAECGKGMYFRVDDDIKPISMFCGNINGGCKRALMEVPIG